MTARPRQGISQGAVVEAAELRLRRRRQQPEADFQRRVVELAQVRGWSVHYIPNWMYSTAMVSMKSRRRGDRDWADSGFPDLVLARAGTAFGGVTQVLFVELKSNVGQLSAAQKAWRDLLISSGATWLRWRPKDWLMVERWLQS